MSIMSLAPQKFVRATILSALLLTPAMAGAQGWKLVGISGQQGDTTPGPGGFAYPDHTLFDIDPLFNDPGFGQPQVLFQLPFINDSQSIGFCPVDGLLYHTGGSEAYSNNPRRTGHDQGGP